jgi:Holliday junction resolvase RusA-like endonuclease
MALRLNVAEAKRIGIVKKTGKSKKTAIATKRPRNEPEGPVSFEIPGDPQVKERARTFLDDGAEASFLNAQGDYGQFRKNLRFKTVTPKETRKFEKFVKELSTYAMKGKEPFTGPLRLEVTFHLDGYGMEWPIDPGAPDASNLVKAIEDGMQGIVFVDDRQICDLLVYKRVAMPMKARTVIQVDRIALLSEPVGTEDAASA